MCIDLFQLMMLLMCNTYPDKEIYWKSIFLKSLIKFLILIMILDNTDRWLILDDWLHYVTTSHSDYVESLGQSSCTLTVLIVVTLHKAVE